MNEAILYHNPRCSKSRGALELLETRELQLRVIRYLETPPDAATLKSLLGKLALPARALLRKGEEEYRSLGLEDPALSDEQIIAAMAAHPRLIERPIFVVGDRAIIGRPPEKVLELLP